MQRKLSRLFACLLLLVAVLVTAPAPRLHAEIPAVAAAPTSTLILHVRNVRNKTGVVRFELFASADGWPDTKSKAIRYGSLPANNGVVTFTISNLPEGSYGISVLHDENENHKLDRDLLGRPKEGIGFGNNPVFHFSVPSWKDSSVHVAGASIEVSVDLRYT